MAFFREFKDFASRGNLVDIAVAFVMGAAFGKIVTTFTQGIVSPIIALVTGGVDFSEKEYVLRKSTEVKDASGAVISGEPAVALQWGTFFTAIIDFLIVALFMFLVIRTITRLKKKKEEVPDAPPSLTTSEQLLVEIRDALKK